MRRIISAFIIITLLLSITGCSTKNIQVSVDNTDIITEDINDTEENDNAADIGNTNNTDETDTIEDDTPIEVETEITAYMTDKTNKLGLTGRTLADKVSFYTDQTAIDNSASLEDYYNLMFTSNWTDDDKSLYSNINSGVTSIFYEDDEMFYLCTGDCVYTIELEDNEDNFSIENSTDEEIIEYFNIKNISDDLDLEEDDELYDYYRLIAKEVVVREGNKVILKVEEKTQYFTSDDDYTTMYTDGYATIITNGEDMVFASSVYSRSSKTAEKEGSLALLEMRSIMF
jgi:hypothetical protein